MRVPIPLHTVYAELVEQAAIQEIGREFPAFGGFTQKTIKGKHYIYWQGQVGGVRRQKFVGADEPETWKRLERAERQNTADDARAKLVEALANAGFPRIPPSGGKVLRALSEAGTFRRGGALIGTWAYLAYGPMLGVILPAGLAQTQDLGILQIEIATGEQPVNLFSVLQEAEATFKPSVSPIDDAAPYAFHSADGYRVEFLTVQSRNTQHAPVRMPDLGIAALPLPFLEYLLDAPVDAVLLYRSGILVKVPSPERFALHKLIVAQRRRASTATTKRQKDLAHAQSLLDILIDDRPEAVRTAWQALLRKGPAWRSSAQASARALNDKLKAFLAIK